MKHFQIALSLTAGLAIACGPGAASTVAEADAATRSAHAAPPPRPMIEAGAGTHLSLIIDTALSSKTSQPGDRIDARLASDLMADGKVIAAAGSAVRGQVTSAVPSGRVKTRARLAFTFDTLVTKGGSAQAIETASVDITADDTHTRDAVTVAGGAGAGAIIGGMVDGKKGAGIGALIGAGTGTGVVLIDKGKNVVVNSGGALTVELTRPLRVRVQD